MSSLFFLKKVFFFGFPTWIGKVSSTIILKNILQTAQRSQGRGIQIPQSWKRRRGKWNILKRRRRRRTRTEWSRRRRQGTQRQNLWLGRKKKTRKKKVSDWHWWWLSGGWSILLFSTHLLELCLHQNGYVIVLSWRLSLRGQGTLKVDYSSTMPAKH